MEWNTLYGPPGTMAMSIWSRQRHGLCDQAMSRDELKYPVLVERCLQLHIEMYVTPCFLFYSFFLSFFFFLSRTLLCISWYTIICWHQVVTAPVCPGGNDFVCCNHHWTRWELGRKGKVTIVRILKLDASRRYSWIRSDGIVEWRKWLPSTFFCIVAYLSYPSFSLAKSFRISYIYIRRLKKKKSSKNSTSYCSRRRYMKQFLRVFDARWIRSLIDGYLVLYIAGCPSSWTFKFNCRCILAQAFESAYACIVFAIKFSACSVKHCLSLSQLVLIRIVDLFEKESKTARRPLISNYSNSLSFWSRFISSW
jgi:hypothetical protein